MESVEALMAIDVDRDNLLDCEEFTIAMVEGLCTDLHDLIDSVCVVTTSRGESSDKTKNKTSSHTKQR